jgi:hypothetical protein
MSKKYKIKTKDRLCKNCKWYEKVTEKHMQGYDGKPMLGDCKLGVTPFRRSIHSDGCLESDREKAYKNLNLKNLTL